MKVLLYNQPLIFKCIPRDNAPEDVTMTLRNELTDVIITVPITYVIDTKKMTVTIPTQPTDFAIQNKYEVIIYSKENIIYIGKLVILKYGTDVQNYEYQNQNTSYYELKQE